MGIMIEAGKNFNKSDPKKKKNHIQKIQTTIIDLLYIEKKMKVFFTCVDKATHMKLNEIMFLLSHGSVTA